MITSQLESSGPILPSPLAGVTGPTMREPHTQTEVYQNPVPVGVAIIPVLAVDSADGREKLGVLTVRRGIEPMKGKLALPGGYMGYETWQEATVREVGEEVGIPVRAADLELVAIRSVRDNTRMIFFSELPYALEKEALANFRMSEEVTAVEVVFAPTELAFSTHTEELAKFFDRRRNVQTDPLRLEITKEGLNPKSQRFLVDVLAHLSHDWPTGGVGFVYSAPGLPRSLIDYADALAARLGFSFSEFGTTGECGDGDIIFSLSPSSTAKRSLV